MKTKFKQWLKEGPLHILIMLAAVLLIAALACLDRSRHNHDQQIIVGEHSAGQIPDSVITDTLRHNDTLIFYPIK